eukprot:EG_transcript_18607
MAKPANSALPYAMAMMKSEHAMLDANLSEDFSVILQGQCIYLPNFFCQPTDLHLFDALKADLASQKEDGMVNWSKHLKHEDPDFSATFKDVVDKIATYFDVEVYATRLNYYRDGTDWKPFHHDSHAYGDRAQREDFTVGASFGGRRDLAFLHEPSGRTFAFPQHNGDVFAFTTEVNRRFMHGVPKAKGQVGERFSVIVWGRRRTLNARNGGAVSSASPTPTSALSPAPQTAPGLAARPLSTHRYAAAQQDIRAMAAQLAHPAPAPPDGGGTGVGAIAPPAPGPPARGRKGRLQGAVAGRQR